MPSETEDLSAPKLTVERKILLHLYSLMEYELEYEVPKELVQDGIAETISVRRDNIPRTMKRLKEEGMVHEVLKRIKGFPRKRKAYFLTREGVAYTKNVWEEVAYHKALLQLSDGSLKQLYLKDISDYLNVRISLVQLLHLMESGSTIKEAMVRAYLSGELPAMEALSADGFVSFLQEVPMPKRFLGRGEELSSIDAWLDRPGGSLLTLTGIAGIGKTTLAAKAAKDREGKMHVFWYRIHKWDSLRNLLFSLSRFLDQIGRSGLKTYLEGNHNLESKDFYPLIESSLKDTQVLMVFDDVQRASDEVVDFFLNFKELLPSMGGIKVVVVGRQVFPFYDRSDVIVKKIVSELSLGGLDKESCRGLLRLKDLDEGLFNKIYQVTKGHPLFLQLILSAKDIEDQKDIKRYIYEEIFKKLDEQASLLLQIASVFRYPVPSEAFFMEEGLDFRVLDQLVDANLIQETSYDEFEAHDLIKEFFYNRLTPKQKQSYHLKAASYYMEVGTERATVEAMYHLALGGESVKALKLASTYGEAVITKGLVEQFASVLSLLEKSFTEDAKEYNAMTRLLSGEVQMLMGRWDRAMSELKRAAVIAEAEDQPLIGAKANLRLGAIELRRGNRETAEKRLKKAYSTSKKLGDKESTARALQALGELNSLRGEFGDAREAMEGALALAKELGDPWLEAASFTGLGVIYTNQDKLGPSIEQFELAIKALERKENAVEMAKVRISLGAVLASTGESEKAIESFEEAVDLSTQTGDIRQQGYALAGAGRVYLLSNQPDTARDYLEEALTIFSGLGERYKIAMVKLDMGRLHLMRGEFEQAIDVFNGCLTILEELNLPFYLRKASKEIMGMLEMRGRTNDLKRFRERAKKGGYL